MPLDMSLRASALIAAVLLLRKVPSVPKRLIVLAWDAVLARLLIPGLVKIPVSAPAAAGASGGAAATPAVPWEGIWLAGALVMGAWMISRYVREYRLLREALPPDPAQLGWIRDREPSLEAEVRVSDRIQSPLAFGLWKAYVILPKSFTDWTGTQFSYATAHEKTHLRRLDNLQKAVMSAALCLHWFNPLVWIMRSMLDRDIERACDEKVISMRGEESRCEYAETLLDMSTRERFWTAYGNGFGENAIHERIVSMMKHKKVTIFAIVAVVAVLALSVTAFAATEASPGAATEASPAAVPAAEAELYDSVIMFDEESGEGAMYSVDGEKVEEVAYQIDTDSGIISENGKQVGTIEKDDNGGYVVSMDDSQDLAVSFSSFQTEDGRQGISVIGN